MLAKATQGGVYGVLINPMQSRNRSLPWLLLILASLLLAFVLLRLRNRVQALAVYPEDGVQLSMVGRIGITFNQPMNTDSIEAHFSIQPEVKGTFTWEGTTLWFTPDESLAPAQTYRVAIAAGAEAENGRQLGTPITWQALIREPDLVYLVLDTSGGDLWRFNYASGAAQPLTKTGANVVDFAPSPTGDLIVYAQNNPLGGSDLWLIDRDGANPEMLVDCQYDRCSQPAWNVDGIWIAYSRESFDIQANRLLPARVWTVNTNSQETAPFYRQAEAFGHSPSFSPDGKRLAIYNSVQNAIRIIELETLQESAIASIIPGVGDWSPDGDELIFIDLVPGLLEPNVTMTIVNFANQAVRDAQGDFIPNMDYDPPQWSPDGDWIAYGVRPVGTAISKGIWIMNLVTKETFPLTDDPSATFTAYRWDPRGERLAFQRFPVSSPSSNASIWLWERSTGQIQRLVENGARPEWLP